MSKQKDLEIFWLNNAGGKAEVHINRFRSGHIDVQVTDVKADLFFAMAESFGLKISKALDDNDVVRWFEFARARDGCKVTVFCEDESQ